MPASDRAAGLATGAATAVSVGGANGKPAGAATAASVGGANGKPAGPSPGGKAAQGASPKAGTATSAPAPPDAANAAAEPATRESRWYRVVFKPRVAVRSQPQLSAIVVASLSKGTVVEAVESNRGWIRLGERDLRRSRVPETVSGWVLVDGKPLGLGLLMQPCDETGATSIRLQVQVPGSMACSLEAFTSWTVQEAKAAIEASTGIPVALQRLFVDGVELRKGMRLDAAATTSDSVADQLEAGSLALQLRQRTEEQAAWSEKFETAGALAAQELSKAPESVREDWELVEEAVGHCGCALRHAASELRANREVVLAAVRSDPAALQYAGKELQADRGVLARTVEQSCCALEQSTLDATQGPGRALEYAVGMLQSTYKRVVGFRSQRGDDKRLHRLRPLQLRADTSGLQAASVFVAGVAPGAKPWLGFGGSFTEAAADTLMKMSSEKQGQILRYYFDKEVGHCYVLGRMSIGSCDFGSGNWSCGDLQENDLQLNAFNIDHYRVSILPMIKHASDVAGVPLRILASPWSPPPWMKTAQGYGGDGHLKTEFYDAWAQHFVRFVQSMARAGVPIWAVSVQNEPAAAQSWESCLYTAKEECSFVRDHLGPTMASAGLEEVKILVWDHNRDGMLERAAHVYSDPEVAKYVWGVAYHWYGDARFEAWPDRSSVYFEDRQQAASPLFEVRSRLGLENVRRVADLRPDKHILQTESCQELGGRGLKACLNDWKLAERYAMNIIADVNAGCEGWIDWNLCLDQNGGPNHAYNFCVAPIICDTTSDEVQLQPCYWYLGHFARFIKPGARRALCGSSRDALEVTAFLNPDGSLVVVVLNQSTESLDFTLKVGEAGAAPTDAPARSITTYVVDRPPGSK